MINTLINKTLVGETGYRMKWFGVWATQYKDRLEVDNGLIIEMGKTLTPSQKQLDSIQKDREEINELFFGDYE